MKTRRALCILCWLGALVAGCSSGGRTFTVRTEPADSIVKIDDFNRGPAPVSAKLSFKSGETHVIAATRFGYSDQSVTLDETYPSDDITLTLKPSTRRITFQIEPLPAIVLVDGKPVNTKPVKEGARELSFPIDAQGHRSTHTITAALFGYVPVSQTIQFNDQDTRYLLTLLPMTKPVRIDTDPPGAQISINDDAFGPSPVDVSEYRVPIDTAKGQWLTQRLKAEKPGYLPADGTISWDDKKKDYLLKLAVHSKTIRVVTEPPGAIITFDKKEYPKNEDGSTTATLQFPPINEKGDLKIYAGVAVPATTDDEFNPTTPFEVKWDEQEQYTVKLQPGKMRRLALHRPQFTRDAEGWHVTDDKLLTTAPADVSETDAKLVRIIVAKEEESIDMIAASPDGTQLAFAVLRSGTRGELRSRICTVRLDAKEAKSLDHLGGTVNLTPCYSPDGTRLLFSSDRGGKGLGIWSIPTDPAVPAEPQRLTPGDEVELWPSLDSLPRPRLFYQALPDPQEVPLLRVMDLKPQDADAAPTELAKPALQPHISPEADRVVFTRVDTNTGKRDVWLVPDGGGEPRNLTNNSGSDDFDPAWSRDAGKIAFVSDRPTPGSATTKPGSFNVWVMEVEHPESALPVTTGESRDDCPAWDATGKYLFFRSNRGGVWAIWRVEVGKK